MDTALELLAQEGGCSEITMGGTGNFARVWTFSAVSAIGLVVLLVVPFIWCRKRTRVIPEGAESDEKNPGKSKSQRQLEMEEDLQQIRPNLEAARRHLKRSSATVNEKYLHPVSTGIDGVSVVGGTGTVLYFETLRTMTYLFATMAAITFPTLAFCLLGSFSPDNGQVLALTSIGNLGLYVDPKILDPLLRIVRAGCDGAQLSDLTAIFAWLDLAAVLILFIYLIRFRFIEIPKRIEEDDLQNVSVTDFAVMIDKLPQRIDQHKNYEEELKEHLETRMRAVQCAHGEKKSPKVVHVTLVRDFGGKLEALKEQAALSERIEVMEAYEKHKRVAKLKKKKEKLDQRIDRHMPDEDELPVLRAYVILNRVEDVSSLLYDYRLARFGLFRCCQSHQKRFHGHALRVRDAPAPTDLLWENQDVPWWSRALRQLFMFLVFVIILTVAIVAIYVITVVGKSQAGNQLSYIGYPSCDPVLPESKEEYVCYVNVAANWTQEYAAGQGGDVLLCWCEAQGYAKLLEEPALVGTCTPWLLETGLALSMMSGASLVVVVLNLILQYVFMAMAEFERPLSNTALNKSMMQKIFLAQTLNTGFVLFFVNTYGPQAARDALVVIPGLGRLLLRGPFVDLTRSWYVVVGATIMTNMLINSFLNSGISIAMVILAKMMRCCCRGRVKHHSELIALYTNPPFDIKAKYAQLLTTTFVTLTYASGMPILYFFAFLYMALMYWTDKVCLLWYSKRPPQYDASLARDSSEYMLYSVALHCIFAVLMFGQPCVFPSQSLGGDLGNLLEQNGGEASGALGDFWPRMTQESTWMFVALLAILTTLWVIWWLQMFFQGTFGAFFSAMWQLCCASHKQQDTEVMEAVKTGKEDGDLDGTLASLGSKAKNFDVAEMLTWDEAKLVIERTGPTSYHWYEHPDQIHLAHHVKSNKSTRKTGTDPEGVLPVPR